MKILVRQSSVIILSSATIRLYQFAFTFLAFHSFIRAEIHIGINNSAVAVKNTTTLHCNDAYVNCSDHTSSKFNAQWFLRLYGITKEVDILKKSPDRISNNAACFGQYDLTIRDVKFEDAGTYYCITQHHQYTAQLIVLDSQLICQASSKESDETVLQCTVAYKGNWPPTMKWRIVDGSEIPSNKVIDSNKRVTSTVKRSTISQLVSGTSARYTCEIFFINADYKSISDATNIPAYHQVWISPEIQTRSRNVDDKKESTPYTNDSEKPGQGNASTIPDNKLLLYGPLLTMLVIVIAVLVTLSTVYNVKHCKEKAPKLHDNANQSNDYYAEISQRGNVSFNNMPVPLSNISLSHFDATSLSSRGISNYPHRSHRHFEEDEIAAYSETRTIASVPVQFPSSRSMLSLNQAAPKSDSLGRIKGHIGPSVDSAMPVYAEVHKPKIPNDKGHVSPSQRLSRSPSEDENQPMTSTSNIGADGTVYMQIGGNNNTAKRNIPLPKKRTETAVYAMVDHTRRLPPPPPPE